MAKQPKKHGKIPIYRQIQQELVNEIELRNLPPNTPYYSEKEIIERFKVSRVTVRQALELMEQDGHIHRIQGKGTFISSLETKPTRTVAFIASCVMRCAAETVLLRAAEEILNEHNFNLVVCNHGNDFARTERYLRRLEKSRIDGIIYACAPSDQDYARNGELVESILRGGTPCVMVDRTVAIPGRGAFSVAADNFRGVYALTEHLLSIGHTRIGFCGPAENSATQERFSGYRQCLADRGLAVQREYVKKMRTPEEHRVTAMQYLMLPERPTAIIAGHDQMALQLIAAFAGFGVRVPEELAVTGFDHCEQAALQTNGLTTVRVPLWEMGKLAASLLVGLLQRRELEPRQVRVPCELVIRESCGVRHAGSQPTPPRPAGVD